MLQNLSYRPVYCFRRSFSTAPALASEDTGSGVNVGRASDIDFMRRCPEEVETRGTAAERGARKGLDS